MDSRPSNEERLRTAELESSLPSACSWPAIVCSSLIVSLILSKNALYWSLPFVVFSKASNVFYKNWLEMGGKYFLAMAGRLVSRALASSPSHRTFLEWKQPYPTRSMSSGHLINQQAEHAVFVLVIRCITPLQGAMFRTTTLLTSASWSEKAKDWQLLYKTMTLHKVSIKSLTLCDGVIGMSRLAKKQCHPRV